MALETIAGFLGVALDVPFLGDAFFGVVLGLLFLVAYAATRALFASLLSIKVGSHRLPVSVDP